MTPKKPRESSRISDAAVKAKTGRAWEEWFSILDKAGARNMKHKEIAAYLYDRLKVPGWWSQMVTVQYEQERGLREKHQTAEGYTATGSRTVAVALSGLYRAWQDKEVRRRWFKDGEMTIARATPKKSLRIEWARGRTKVDVNFYDKGKGKSQVTVDHRKLADAREAARMKAYWAENLDRLKSMFEG